MDNWCN